MRHNAPSLSVAVALAALRRSICSLPFSLPFRTLSLSAALRIRAPCRLPALLSLSSPAFFPLPVLVLAFPLLRAVRSLSPSRAPSSAPSSLIPSLIPCPFVSPLFSSSRSSRTFSPSSFFPPSFSFSRSFTFLLRFFRTFSYLSRFYLFHLPSLSAAATAIAVPPFLRSNSLLA